MESETAPPNNNFDSALPVSPQKQISMDRLTHLEEIFRHYCTHIFRVGKHMTFDRLEYERIHMTIQRFFTFLKDFGLTVASIEGKIREIVSKSRVITIFKKVSPNSKDLTFEQFIECLERIGVAHFDERELYHLKLEKAQKQRKKRKLLLQKRKKLAQSKNEANNNQNNKSPEQAQHEQEGIKSAEENDDLVNEMMENKEEIVNPQDELEDQLMNKNGNGGEGLDNNNLEGQDAMMNDNDHFDGSEGRNGHPGEALLNGNSQMHSSSVKEKVPNEVKIEIFYKLIGVDNKEDYRKKLSELNLPLFKSAKESANQAPKPEAVDLDRSGSLEDEETKQRLQMIKEKLNEKKASTKNSPPKRVQIDQNQVRRQEQEKKMKKQRDKERKQKAKKKQEEDSSKLVKAQQEKMQQVKEKQKQKDKLKAKQQTVVYNENNVTWDVERMNFQQLNLKQFHPHYLYNLDPEDNSYMGDLGFDNKALEKYRQMHKVKPNNSQRQPPKPPVAGQSQLKQIQKIAELKEKKTEAVVLSAKRRVSQIQKSEKLKQKSIHDMSRKLSEVRTGKSKVRIQ